MELSVTEAAIEGLRVAKRAPGTVAIWAGVYCLGLFLAILLAFLCVGAPLFSLVAKPASTPFSDALAEQMFAGVGLGILIVIPVLSLMSAMLAAAIFRSVLKPDERGFAYLKLGGDEFRLLGAMILVNLVTLAVLGVVGGAVAAAVYALWAQSKMLSFLLGAFGGMAVAVLMIWIGVRLSLAYILTFAERRIQLRSSWDLTKGRFWPLLGMILIVAVINIGIGFAVSVAGGIIQMIVAAPAMMSMGADASPELGSMSVLVIIAALINFVLNLVAIGLQLVVTYAPQASVYKQLKGQDVSAVF
jgi:hypothetical protein